MTELVNEIVPAVPASNLDSAYFPGILLGEDRGGVEDNLGSKPEVQTTLPSADFTTEI